MSEYLAEKPKVSLSYLGGVFLIIAMGAIFYVCLENFLNNLPQVRGGHTHLEYETSIKQEGARAAKLWLAPNANPYHTTENRKLWLEGYMDYREQHLSIGQP